MAWRGVIVCVVVVLGGGDRPASPVQLKCGASGAHAGVHAVERTLPHDCTEELVLRPDDRLALDVGAWLCDAVGIAEHLQVGSGPVGCASRRIACAHGPIGAQAFV
jgi:hypothetical protein